MIHICLDLETWGTTPGSDIRSIGATLFDPTTGEVSIPCRTCKGGTTGGNVNDGGDCSDCMNTRMERGFGDTFYLACDNPIITMDGNSEGPTYKYPLTRNPQTVKWWSEQSAEAQAAFSEPVDLRDALINFTGWLQRITDQTEDDTGPSPHLRIWAHGAAFDPPILAAAYAACGLPVPWHYRAPRDTRTAFDMAGITDHSAHLERYTTGTFHHALDDAIAEARAICEAYARLRRGAVYYAVKNRLAIDQTWRDVITHRDAWRNAIECAKEWDVSPDDPERSYYDHELTAFDRTFAQLAKLAGEIDHV